MSGTGASLNDKIDLAPWGYAPGDQLVTCSDCHKIDPLDSLHFLHRHATRCASHALEARHRDIRASEGHLVPDPDQQLADEALGLIKAVSDRFIRQAFIASLILAPVFIGIVLLIGH
jgi:hypothetical protein